MKLIWYEAHKLCCASLKRVLGESLKNTSVCSAGLGNDKEDDTRSYSQFHVIVFNFVFEHNQVLQICDTGEIPDKGNLV
jgi:hypothetical protein